jgi:hypothetical protein
VFNRKFWASLIRHFCNLQNVSGQFKATENQKKKMNYNWKDISWIFKSDETLRDIYIQDTSLNDWGKLIDLLNAEYKLKWFSENKIDKNKVYKYLQDETGEVENSTVSIQIENIKINCHFFLIEQIEFDIAPNQIKNKLDVEKILFFMTKISSTLKKQITLTGENDANFPLIKINTEENVFKIITEKEIKEFYNENNSKIKSLIISLKFKLLSKIFPKFMKNLILKSANETIKATKLNENLW